MDLFETVGSSFSNNAIFHIRYANTEVVRDLTDEDRYNLLVPIGKALGFDVDTKPGEAPFWIDHVMSILAMVVSTVHPLLHLICYVPLISNLTFIYFRSQYPGP